MFNKTVHRKFNASMLWHMGDFTHSSNSMIKYMNKQLLSSPLIVNVRQSNCESYHRTWILLFLKSETNISPSKLVVIPQGLLNLFSSLPRVPNLLTNAPSLVNICALLLETRLRIGHPHVLN